jgi:peptide deformylase
MEFNLKQTPALRKKSVEWDFIIDKDPQCLSQNMIDFMLKHNGIGLAANQIDITKRIFVMGSNTHTDFPKPFAVINPVIIESSTKFIEDTEGCLSYPNLWLKIKRPEWVVGGFYTVDGIYQEEKFKGYAAKCFQHELDHLDGICFVDKVSQLKLNLAMKKQRKLNDRTYRQPS